MNTLRGSWISLFAVLMIFIGPLISQSMPMEHERGMPMDLNLPMGMGMDMSMDHSAHHGQPSAADPQLHPLWEKCGYCSLFFHCPALPNALSLMGDAVAALRDKAIASPLHGHAGQAVFPGALTRAPPSSRFA